MAPKAVKASLPPSSYLHWVIEESKTCSSSRLRTYTVGKSGSMRPHQKEFNISLYRGINFSATCHSSDDKENRDMLMTIDEYRQKKIATISHRKEKDQSVSYIPQDIITTNILHRVQAQTLYNGFRHGCKCWSRIIADPSFIEQHLLHSVPGLIIQQITTEAGNQSVMHFIEMKKNGNPVVQFLDRGYDVEVHVSCNGLLLLQNKSHREVIYISNPVTKKSEKLPPCTNSEVNALGLAFDPSTRKYKAVNLFVINGIVHCEILAFGGGGGGGGGDKWRGIEVPLVELPQGLPNTPASIKGVLYWVMKSKDYVGCLDVSEEKFHWIFFPDITMKNSNIIQIGDCAALLHNPSPAHIDVWILKDFREAIWIKQHSIILQCERYIDDVQPVACLRNGDAIIFLGPERSFFIYSFKSNRLREIGIRMNGQSLLFCNAHVNSLVSWK